jgi:hypothetical protein
VGAAKIVFIGLAALFGFTIFKGWQQDETNNASAAAALQSGDWAKYAQARLPGDSGSADLVDGVLSMNYHEAALTNGTFISGFNVEVARLVPEIFAEAKEVQVVTIADRGDFVDLRGHKSIGDAMRVTFTRENAAQVNWSNVSYDNIPKETSRVGQMTHRRRRDLTSYHINPGSIDAVAPEVPGSFAGQ